MTSDSKPETLVDLLKTLERSSDLRVLARDCGLSVRELRRRLAIWRRTLNETGQTPDDDAAGPSPAGPPIPTGESGLPGQSVPSSRPGRAARDAERPKGKGAVLGDLPRAAGLAESPLPREGSQVLEVFTDGASRGNPGPAAIGVLFRQKNGPDLAGHSEAIGKATNNLAEYKAVVTALEHCRRWGIERVHLFMDSELIVRQLHGVYRVKSPDLRPLYQQVVFLSKQLKEFRATHVKRANNSPADALANEALDAQG